jgi:hypothetical protein
MKLQTKIDDLKKLIAANTAAALADRDFHSLTEAVRVSVTMGINREGAITALDRSIASRTAATAAAAPLAKLPPARRDLAASTAKAALEIGRRAALSGESYSGDTDYLACWTERPDPDALTMTAKGDKYSRSCKYLKTDADHIVYLAPEWTPLLVEREELRTLSARDGLPLIGIAGDGRCAWTKRNGKAITAEIGWIAFFGTVCYHSTTSQGDADKGLARKLAAMRREWVQAEEQRQLSVLAGKAERRARLIARLCVHVTATVADARALGFCPAGIEQFQSQHGIGNSASLPELVRTGNASAIRLALNIARKVTREKQQAAA